MTTENTSPIHHPDGTPDIPRAVKTFEDYGVDPAAAPVEADTKNRPSAKAIILGAMAVGAAAIALGLAGNSDLDYEKSRGNANIPSQTSER